MENQQATPNSSQAQITNTNEAPFSVKDWIITLLLTSIPLVGLILLFYWAFNSSENKNRSNWAKAILIILLIGIAIYLIIILVVSGFYISTKGYQS